MILLYDKQECPFCWRVRMTLDRLNLLFENIDRMDPGVNERWCQLSPAGTVPVFESDELVLTDSSVILEYLIDRNPTLLPGSPETRAYGREIMQYGDSVVGKYIREIVFKKRDRPEAEWNTSKLEASADKYFECAGTLQLYLKDSGLFMSTLSVVDFVIASRVGLATAYGVGIPPSAHRLIEWFDAMQSLPLFRRTAPARVLEATGSNHCNHSDKTA